MKNVPVDQPSARTSRPVIRGAHYAISTRKPQATQAGERVLLAGGNAFDAAVAAFAVLAVTDPAMTGIGGDAFALIYSADENRVWSINGGGSAPALGTIDWFREHAGGEIPVNDGLLAASLPGVLDVCYQMLDRWGTMSFAQLLAPAIELADGGFPISEYLADFLEFSAPKLRKYPTSAALYFAGSRSFEAGDVLRNPGLAKTLRKIVEAEEQAASQGRRVALRAARDRFYRGDIAQAIGEFCQSNGGLFRYEDFARYEAKVETPISVNYRGYDVYKNPSANQGPVELILLNLLSAYDLKSLGHNSPAYIHLCIEAAKLAYRDREQYLGDADFIQIPFDHLLSQEYAAERRAQIPNKANTPAARAAGQANHDGDTSYLAIVDEKGNAVSFTPSLHSAFGTGVAIGDTGVILNCRGDFWHLDPGHPNAMIPGKRVRSTLTPTLVMKDGRLNMVLGSPGGDDQPLRIAQTFLNMVDFGMNVQEAIEAPRWSTTSFPASEFPHTEYPNHIALEERIPPDVRGALGDRGHIVEMKGAWTLGATCAVVVDRERGILSAGADPRGDSYALSW